MAAVDGGSGGGSGSGLAAGSSATVVGKRSVDGPADTRLHITLRGDATFRLNIFSTTDDWATKEIVKQVASGTVTNDGGTANYVNAADVTDWSPPDKWLVEVRAVGGTLAWKVNYREIVAGR